VHAGLHRLPPEPLDTELQGARINAHVNQAFSYDQLGDSKRAIKACDDALMLDPAHPDALMLRALLTQPVDPQSARNDARRGFGGRLASQLSELPLSGVMSGVGS
jgi:hypothetical protein